jgi:PAS domain S-box-containing protein
LSYEWLDHLPLPAVIIRKACFVYVNDACLELLALTREQCEGLRFDTRVAPEDRKRIAAIHDARLRGAPVPSNYELSVIRGDGERRAVELFISPVGEDTLFELYDVTDRVAHQENLRSLARLGAAVQRELSEEAIFRAVDTGLHSLGAAVMRMVPDGDGVRVVQTLGAVERLKAELGADAFGARRPWSPNVRKAWAEGFAFLEELKLSLVNLIGAEHDAMVRRNVEEPDWLRGSMIRLDVLGLPREILLVTAVWLRLEDEPLLALFGAQISAALDAARVIRDLSSRNAELTALNHIATAAGTATGLAELFAHASRELTQVTGCTWMVLYLVDEPTGELRLAHHSGAVGEELTTYPRLLMESRQAEVIRLGHAQIWKRGDLSPTAQQLMLKSRSHYVVAVPMMIRARVIGVINVGYANAQPVPPQQVELLGAMAAHLAAAFEANRLVEDLRRSYDELSRAQAQLVQRERLAALGEMAAALAHEVRNPLAVIFNSLVALPREIAAGQDGAQLMAIMKEESDRINHLVGDLLDFARPTQPLLSDELPLVSAVNEAVVAVLGLSPVEIDFELHNEADVEKVPMDARLMRQVFFNIANNAVQAMPQGGKLRVFVRSERSRPEPRIQVVFEDTGHGIPASVMSRVFEPFFTTRARGTGLGLALVKRIVEGHRGDVDVSSTPANGTRVIVAWPISA